MSTNLATKIKQWEAADWAYTKSPKRPYTSKTGRPYGTRPSNAKRSN
jgi:hypothetical protein